LLPPLVARCAAPLNAGSPLHTGACVNALLPAAAIRKFQQPCYCRNSTAPCRPAMTAAPGFGPHPASPGIRSPGTSPSL